MSSPPPAVPASRLRRRDRLWNLFFLTMGLANLITAAWIFAGEGFFAGLGSMLIGMICLSALAHRVVHRDSRPIGGI